MAADLRIPFKKHYLASSILLALSSPSAFACVVGEFDNGGGCTLSPPGYYTDTTTATAAIACPVGEFTATTGSSACNLAPAGSYVSLTGSTSATACAVGSLSATAGSSACDLAAPGSYVSSTGSTSAIACAAGSLSATAGSTACDLAPPGSYVSSTGFSSATACAVGSLAASAGSTACDLAAPGSYVPLTGSTSATACAAGTLSATAGSSACDLAAPGSYVSSTGSTSAIACAAGTLSATAGSTACDLAPPGSYVSSTGFSSATACAVGSLAASAGSTACDLAAPGSYVPLTGSTSATACAAGTLSASAGSSACDLAAPGSYVSSTGSTSAIACAAGTLSASAGSTACDLAPAGSYVSLTGSSAATLCASGTYSPTSGSTAASTCTSANIGYYVANAGSSAQTISPVGYFVATTGAAAATACPTGKFTSTTGQSACTVAPAGSFVSVTGASASTACSVGTFSSTSGQNVCTSAPVGSFVSTTGAIASSLCSAGSYSATAAASACTLAAAGSFVASAGSSSATLASPGYFVAVAGATAQTAAPLGKFVDASGAIAASVCPTGLTTTAVASIACSPIAGFPVVTAPADITVDATGLLTKVDIGTASATDAEDGDLTPNNGLDSLYFAPGKHTVTWTATDSDGNAAEAEQLVNVRPLISIKIGQVVEEGTAVGIRVSLNGEAISYPVSIPYVVSGTATSGEDHNLQSGTLLIQSGRDGFITFKTLSDSQAEGTENIIVTLGTPQNAALGNAKSHTVFIEEGNTAPEVYLSASQNDSVTRIIRQDGGAVVVSADVIDANSGDSHRFDWSLTDNVLVDIDNTDSNFSFDPSALPEDIYTLRVVVDDGTTTVAESINLAVKETLVVLDSSDSDKDGVSDADEGFTDDDNDGIPAYLDAIVESNIIQQQKAENSQFLIETNPGLQLEIGDVAFKSDAYSAGVTKTQLSNLLQQVDSALQDDDNIFNIKVSKLTRSGDAVQVVVPQYVAIPERAIVRLNKASGWSDFSESDSNTLSSAPGDEGFCPPPNDESYTAGLTAGHWCVQLSLVDGSANDGDELANAKVDLLGYVGEQGGTKKKGWFGALSLFSLLAGLTGLGLRRYFYRREK